jgi:pentatricopeptide repeat protein
LLFRGLTSSKSRFSAQPGLFRRAALTTRTSRPEHGNSDHRPQIGFPQDDETKAKQIKYFVKSDRKDSAEGILRSAIEKKDRVSIISCASALLMSLLHQGNLERATRWLRELDGMGITMPVGVLCIFLDSHSKLRNAQLVREFALRVTDHPEFAQLSTRTYNSLISAFTRLDDIDAARRYFERMISQRVPPDQITFATLIG